MCGIAGIISLDTSLVSITRLNGMAGVLAHRGPDGSGFWISGDKTAGFAHRRLSIIDTGESGRQPMHYLNRYTIVFNGEIYNYIELRDHLQKKGFDFKSRSDTEVILAAYACYGENCLLHFDGMFAFVIVDELEKTVFAARDRFGEKPFFYHLDETSLLFASEMKALWAVGVERSMDERMLFNFLSLGYVQAPADASLTFYRNIKKLPAGAFLKGNIQRQTFTIYRYWHLDIAVNSSIREGEVTSRFRELMITSVKRRLRSDVPWGTSLSGGLDSSSIVAVIRQILDTGMAASSALHTFSAVFPGFEKDETPFIQLLTDQFSLENYRVEPTAESLVNNFEKLCYYQEEPFNSSSIYAQYMVFALAAQKGISVLLDGQGADEMLAGYHKYYPWFWQELYLQEGPLEHELHEAKKLGVKEQWDWKNKLAALFPRQAQAVLKRARFIRQKQNVGFNKEFIHAYGASNYALPLPGSLNSVLHYNTAVNGLEELLRYADRNSMAHGREVRLPFLSHELVQFVFSLPSHYKVRQGWTKWILRSTMADLLPPEIVWRTDKTGYEPPQKKWMANVHLQEYIHEARKTLVDHRILHKEILEKKIQPLDAHAADNADWRYLVAGTIIR